MLSMVHLYLPFFDILWYPFRKLKTALRLVNDIQTIFTIGKITGLSLYKLRINIHHINIFFRSLICCKDFVV